MSPRRLAKAALLGLVAGAVVAAGACSLILPAGDLDAQTGVGAGGGGPGTSTSTSGPGASTSTSTGTVASSSSGAGGGGAGGGDAGCCADGGCASDPANCGTCGHVCPPGPPASTCNQGRCSAAPLVPGGATTFSCGEGAVFWNDGNNDTQRVPVDGGLPCTCASGIGTDTIGVAAGYVVLGTYDQPIGRRVFAWRADCCDEPAPYVPVASSAPWSDPIGLKLGMGFPTDGTNVYWLDDYDVMRVPIDGGAAEPVYAWEHDAAAPGPSGLALTGSRLLVNASQTKTVYGLSTAGQVLYEAPAQYSSGGVRTNGTYVVWASENHGVYFMPVTGVTASQLASFNPTGVAIDEGYVYAIDGTNGLIVRWTIADLDAGPTTLETLPVAAAPTRLCADGPNLYWLVAGGAIYQGDKNSP